MIIRRFASFTLSLLLVSLPVFAKPTTYTIDQNLSTVAFSARNYGFKVTGKFMKFSGVIVADPVTKTIISASGSILTDSVNTRIGSRDRHLRSDDFFNVSQFPTMQFKSAQIADQTNHLVVPGTLTLLGITNPIELPIKNLRFYTTDTGEAALSFESHFKVDRVLYGMTYARGFISRIIPVGLGIVAIQN